MKVSRPSEPTEPLKNKITQTEIATMFGVCPSHVSRILSMERWGSIS